MKSLEQVVVDLMQDLEKRRANCRDEDHIRPTLAGEQAPEIVYFRSKKRRDQ